MTTAPTGRRPYQLLTGPDDSAFCERVSAAIDDGYVLHGSPAATFDGTRVIVAQALVLPTDPTTPTPRDEDRVSYAGDLTPQQAWDLLTADERAILVDVRTDGEWRQIGVPDATAIGDRAAFVEWVTAPTGQVNPRFVDELGEAGLQPGDERPVVFLCRSGVRSIAAAQSATAAGFGPAYNVLEGFEGGLGPDGQRGHEGWRAAGLPWTTL